jgi:hypothetical protein
MQLSLFAERDLAPLPKPVDLERLRREALAEKLALDAFLAPLAAAAPRKD